MCIRDRNLLQYVVPHDNLTKWFIFFWESFQNLKQSINNELARAKIDSIFINLNIIVQTTILHNKKLILGDDHDNKLKFIFEDILNVFQGLNEILPELLIFLVSMIELEHQIYQPFIETFIKEYLGRAINQKTHPKLFQIGITCMGNLVKIYRELMDCLLYTSPSPRDLSTSRMPSSA